MKDTITRIMGSLLRHEVAVLYNWCGQRGPKQKFSVLKAVVNMIFGKYENTIVIHLFYTGFFFII